MTALSTTSPAGPLSLLWTVSAVLPPRGWEGVWSRANSAAEAAAPLPGEVRLLGRLDYELQRSYRLAVLLADHSQDQDPTHRRSGSCTITIEVEVVQPQGLGEGSDFSVLLSRCTSVPSIGWLTGWCLPVESRAARGLTPGL